MQCLYERNFCSYCTRWWSNAQFLWNVLMFVDRCVTHGFIHHWCKLWQSFLQLDWLFRKWKKISELTCFWLVGFCKVIVIWFAFSSFFSCLKIPEFWNVGNIEVIYKTIFVCPSGWNLQIHLNRCLWISVFLSLLFSREILHQGCKKLFLFRCPCLSANL